jgi:hypothetical protein
MRQDRARGPDAPCRPDDQWTAPDRVPAHSPRPAMGCVRCHRRWGPTTDQTSRGAWRHWPLRTLRAGCHDRLLTPGYSWSSPTPAPPSRWWDAGVYACSAARAETRVQASDGALCPCGRCVAPGGEPSSQLDFAAAAALPLTTITAWDLLFDRLGVRPGKPSDAGSLLIIGAGGGVGSILI